MASPSLRTDGTNAVAPAWGDDFPAVGDGRMPSYRCKRGTGFQPVELR
ncbi:MAG: hypothetical protein NZ874_07945 [Fimbriimonadales bacterium]|nr:hypothetical protein [Fimbriimonadales bacterium]